MFALLLLLLLLFILTVSHSADLWCPLDRCRCCEDCRWRRAGTAAHRGWSPLRTQHTARVLMQSEGKGLLHAHTHTNQPVSQRLPVNPLAQRHLLRPTHTPPFLQGFWHCTGSEGDREQRSSSQQSSSYSTVFSSIEQTYSTVHGWNLQSIHCRYFSSSHSISKLQCSWL